MSAAVVVVARITQGEEVFPETAVELWPWLDTHKYFEWPLDASCLDVIDREAVLWSTGTAFH